MDHPPEEASGDRERLLQLPPPQQQHSNSLPDTELDEDVTFTNGMGRPAQETEPEPPPPPPPAKRKLLIGVLLLLLVDIVWVASAELTEYIFKTQRYDKPFFSSYLKTSMFTIFLSGFACWAPWHERCLLEFGGAEEVGEYRLVESSAGRRASFESAPTAIDSHIDNNANSESNCSSPALSAPVYVPLEGLATGYHSDSSNSSHQQSVRFHKLAEVRHLSNSQAVEARHARLSYAASLQAELLAKRLASKLSIRETASLSLTFCVLWFSGAWTYQLAISSTEAGVVNLLSSSSSLFTLVLASLFPSGEGDRFSWSKLLAVAASCGGVVLVTLSDSNSKLELHFPFGALYSLLSAFFYASYLVFLRRRVRDEERLDIWLFFGFVGLFNLLLLWPVFIVLHYTGLELFEWPNHQQWVYLVLNGFIGTVLAEVAWLWGSLLTTSLLATLSVSLTIPLTIFADVFFKHISYGVGVYAGSLPMIFSFVGVSLLSHLGGDPVVDCCRRCRRSHGGGGGHGQQRYSLIEEEDLREQLLLEEDGEDEPAEVV